MKIAAAQSARQSPDAPGKQTITLNDDELFDEDRATQVGIVRHMPIGLLCHMSAVKNT